MKDVGDPSSCNREFTCALSQQSYDDAQFWLSLVVSNVSSWGRAHIRGRAQPNLRNPTCGLRSSPETGSLWHGLRRGHCGGVS